MTGTERIRKMMSTRNAKTGVRINKSRSGKKALQLSFRQIMLITMTLLFLLLSGIGYVWSNFERTQIGYDLSELKKEELRLRDLNRKLRLELAFLKSPANLEMQALRKLGLRQPSPEQIVTLP